MVLQSGGKGLGKGGASRHRGQLPASFSVDTADQADEEEEDFDAADVDLGRERERERDREVGRDSSH